MPGKRRGRSKVPQDDLPPLNSFSTFEKLFTAELDKWNAITARLNRGEPVSDEMARTMTLSQVKTDKLASKFKKLILSKPPKVVMTEEEWDKMETLMGPTMQNASQGSIDALKADQTKRRTALEATGYTLTTLEKDIDGEIAKIVKYRAELGDASIIHYSLGQKIETSLLKVADLQHKLDILTCDSPKEERKRVTDRYDELTSIMLQIQRLVRGAPTHVYSEKDYQRAQLRQRIKAAKSKRTNPHWRPLDNGEELFKKEVERCNKERLEQARIEEERRRENDSRF